jgi:predicted AlkP superfamily phosphohydrolase/phosphomutase
MKLLIYGIDGGDLAVMQKFPMPFLRSFLEANDSLEMQADLVNRGWAEILTGKGSHETGAFYMAPALDGTHRGTASFRMSMLADRDDITPMWDLFEAARMPYVIMNVPTSTPVPDVEHGVVIGSGGGGLNKVEGIPPELVSDPSVIPLLESKDYIVDIRIPNDAYDKTADLLDDLVRMEERRTDCFIDLCTQRDARAGFLCNRGTTIIEYLARSEIESYDAYETLEEFMPRHGDKPWMHEKLEAHFAMLDRQIERLYHELKPDHFIITADHGVVPHKFRANLNAFLLDAGFLRKRSSPGVLNTLRRLRSTLGLQKATAGLASRVPAKAKDLASQFDWKRSRAFSPTFTLGLFINDARRFDGPVKEKDLPRLVDELCEAFNAMPDEQRMGMSAVPYRGRDEFADAPFRDKLPDIKIENAEGIVSNLFIPTNLDNDFTRFIQPNPSFGPVPANLQETRGKPMTGDKGQPLLLITRATADHVRDDDPRNLTLVHKLVERIVAPAAERDDA